MGSGLRGPGMWVPWGFGFGLLECRISGLWLRVCAFGPVVQAFGFKVWGVGFPVSACWLSVHSQLLLAPCVQRFCESWPVSGRRTHQVIAFLRRAQRIYKMGKKAADVMEAWDRLHEHQTLRRKSLRVWTAWRFQDFSALRLLELLGSLRV